MDVPSDALTNFRALARQLDDDALVALGNRGLLKRALKALAKARPEIVGYAGETLLLTAFGYEVHLTMDPAAARCSCPSTKTCQHILGAWLSLRAESEEPEGSAEAEEAGDADQDASNHPDEPPGPEEDPLKALISLPEEELRAWGGTKLLRQALREQSMGAVAKLDEHRPGRVLLALSSHEVRWLSGQPWQAALCSCHAKEPCIHRMLAILEVQRQRGGRVRPATSIDAQPRGETVRSREELVPAVREAVLAITERGLSRLSRAQAARIDALATSAHGVDLPRLERELQGLAGQFLALLAREAHADSESAALQLARILALTEALASGRAGLVGLHKGHFVRAGNLELIGLGARHLSTRSGFVGIVCYFWDLKSKSFCSWSDVRDKSLSDFSPEAIFHAPGPWQGCQSPASACVSRFRLQGAWKSSAGRLSGRQSTRYQGTGKSDWSQVSAFDDWQQLKQDLCESFLESLRESDEFAQLVLLRPSDWCEQGFDEVQQEWRATLLDSEERKLPMIVPGNDTHNLAISRLATMPTAPSALLGFLRLEERGYSLLPISCLLGEQIHSLTLPAAPGLTSRRAQPKLAAAVLAHSPPIEQGASALAETCSTFLQALVDHCERGTRAPMQVEALASGHSLEAAGLTLLRRPLQALQDAEGNASSRAHALLHGLHLAQRARSALLIRS
ncbi:MAG: hypothetical protein CSA62_01195 [Planctomycetota bacterium]|nr:MAG: hypothetical protein CSA62_01195 [Planctomycetota bacterium]